MPPKAIPDTRAVARKGNQTLHARTKSEKERSVILPSTARALQLLNAKGGGQLTKISGREKMEQIAEDEMMKAKEARKQAFSDSAQGAVRAPFNMEVAKKVAQSQMDAYIDTVNHLHQNDLCYSIVNMEIQAQCPPRVNPKDTDPLKSPAFVAEQFAIVIHNSYMLASGWTIVYESLKYLDRLGLEDKAVLQQLKNNKQMRTVYLLAFNLIKKLANSSQQRLRSIVQNTEHYHKYFKASAEAKGQMSFDSTELRDLNKSYLDSAIVELCLPGSQYSPQALYHILNTVEQETPRELKRCPQIMWDTVGDLAEAVRLLDMVEMPLLSADGLILNEDLGEYTEFIQWDEAQEKSIKAALDISSFVNLVHPLANVKSKITLDKIWDRIDDNYVRASGKKIDNLWQLVDVRERIPHFSVLYVPSEALSSELEHSTAEQPKKKPLAITQNGEEGYDSDDSMPGLLEVSDSEDEEVEDNYLTDTDEDDDDDESSGDGDYDDEDPDDDDEEEDLRRQYRQAMNIFAEMPEIFDLPPDSTDKYAKERKSNPFLSLLGKLKGRMFSSSSALRTDGKTTATTKPSAPKAKKPSAKPKPATEKPADTQPKKATVEDADDESDDGQKTDKKKKKKKPKKKKKSTTETVESAETPTSPTPSQTPLRAEANTPSSPPSPKVDKKQGQTQKAPSIQSGLSGTTAFGSTISLPQPLPVELKAGSAHKYLNEEGLTQVKSKIKTRPEQSADDPEPVKEGRRLFGRFGGGPSEVQKKDSKESYNAVFGRLKNKTSAIARKVFGASAQDKKGNVKWEQFLQVMRELGFSYDPSTAGSSVRFDPPNPNDRSVTFHKPHPDPTLYQYRLRDIRAKLRDYYGFTFQQFDDAVNHIGKMGVDADEK